VPDTCSCGAGPIGGVMVQVKVADPEPAGCLAGAGERSDSGAHDPCDGRDR